MFWFKYTVILFCLVLSGHCAASVTEDGPGLELFPGRPPSDGIFTYGWSHPENTADGVGMCWIEGFEGQINVPAVNPSGDVWHLVISAMPILCDRRQQSFGLYVNRRFCGVQRMPNETEFHDYEFAVPGDVLAATNTIVLRAGYVWSPDDDPRDLSIAVKRVQLFTGGGHD